MVIESRAVSREYRKNWIMDPSMSSIGRTDDITHFLYWYIQEHSRPIRPMVAGTRTNTFPESCTQ